MVELHPNGCHVDAVQHGDTVDVCIGIVGLGRTPSSVLYPFSHPPIDVDRYVSTYIFAPLHIILPPSIIATWSLFTK
jgi:hypothetical protein